MRDEDHNRPILFVDVDGVISLFGFPSGDPAPGSFHCVEGMVHCLGDHAGERLGRLADRYETVWATGWEGRAKEYLPALLGLAGPEWPVLRFDEPPVWGSANWKVEAIDEYADDRPAAWIDDNLDERCRRWARRRAAPTLLVQTDPAIGIAEDHVEQLLEWAEAVAGTEGG